MAYYGMNILKVYSISIIYLFFLHDCDFQIMNAIFPHENTLYFQCKGCFFLIKITVIITIIRPNATKKEPLTRYDLEGSNFSVFSSGFCGFYLILKVSPSFWVYVVQNEYHIKSDRYRYGNEMHHNIYRHSLRLR